MNKLLVQKANTFTELPRKCTHVETILFQLFFLFIVIKNLSTPTVNARLAVFIDSLGITNNGFSKRVGVVPSVIGNIIGGRLGKPSYELLEKIAITHPTLSVEWLVRGEGQMLRGAAGETECQKQLKALTGKYADLEEDYERATTQLERLKKLGDLL